MSETKLDRIQYQYKLPLYNIHFDDKVENAIECLKRYSDVRDVLLWSDGEIHWNIRILHNAILQNQQTEWLKNTKFYIAGCHVKKVDSIKYDYGNEIIFLDLYPTPFTIFNKHLHFEPVPDSWKNMIKDAETNLEIEKSDLENKQDKVELVTWMAFGKRTIRDYLYLQLCKRNLTRNVAYHSKLKERYSELKYATEEEFESIGRKKDYKEYQKVIFSLPKKLNNTNIDMVRHQYYQSSLYDYYRGLFALITETQFEFGLPPLYIHEEPFEVISLTEKLMFPFFTKSIPMILHDEGMEVKNYLKKLGFDMFEDIIDDDIYKGSAVDKIDNTISILEKYQNKNVQNLFLKYKKRLESNQKLALNFTEEIAPAIEQLKTLKAQNIKKDEIIPPKMSLI
tara:strand:+ start:480 stop:1664 length:1185 start_codon:yes stop_codon:yes gene_type:complete